MFSLARACVTLGDGHFAVGVLCPCVVQGTATLGGTMANAIQLQVPSLCNSGLAVSPELGVIAVTNEDSVSIYSIADASLIRTVGEYGSGKGQFDRARKVCFTPTGNLLVAEQGNMRVQEITLAGEHVRFFEQFTIGKHKDLEVISVAANAELVAVGLSAMHCQYRVILVDAVSGKCTGGVGEFGYAPGHMLRDCAGIRITPDGEHVLVAEDSGTGLNARVSVFSVYGGFLGCLTQGELSGASDVAITGSGDIIVCDAHSGTVALYSAVDRVLVRRVTGTAGAGNEIVCPTAIAVCGSRLYVLDDVLKRVTVHDLSSV